MVGRMRGLWLIVLLLACTSHACAIDVCENDNECRMDVCASGFVDQSRGCYECDAGFSRQHDLSCGVCASTVAGSATIAVFAVLLILAAVMGLVKFAFSLVPVLLGFVTLVQTAGLIAAVNVIAVPSSLLACVQVFDVMWWRFHAVWGVDCHSDGTAAATEFLATVCFLALAPIIVAALLKLVLLLSLAQKSTAKWTHQVLMLMMYIPLTRLAFDCFTCMDVEWPDGSIHVVLAVQPGVDCSGGAVVAAQILAALSFVVYGLYWHGWLLWSIISSKPQFTFVPRKQTETYHTFLSFLPLGNAMGVMGLVNRCRKHEADVYHPQEQAKYEEESIAHMLNHAAMMLPYRQHIFWYEILWNWTRLLLVFCLWVSPSSYGKLILMSVVTIALLTILLSVKPHNQPEFTYLAVMNQVILLFVLFAAIVMISENNHNSPFSAGFAVFIIALLCIAAVVHVCVALWTVLSASSSLSRFFHASPYVRAVQLLYPEFSFVDVTQATFDKIHSEMTALLRTGAVLPLPIAPTTNPEEEEQETEEEKKQQQQRRRNSTSVKMDGHALTIELLSHISPPIDHENKLLKANLHNTLTVLDLAQEEKISVHLCPAMTHGQVPPEFQHGKWHNLNEMMENSNFFDRDTLAATHIYCCPHIMHLLNVCTWQQQQPKQIVTYINDFLETHPNPFFSEIRDKSPAKNKHWVFLCLQLAAAQQQATPEGTGSPCKGTALVHCVVVAALAMLYVLFLCFAEIDGIAATVAVLLGCLCGGLFWWFVCQRQQHQHKEYKLTMPMLVEAAFQEALRMTEGEDQPGVVATVCTVQCRPVDLASSVDWALRNEVVHWQTHARHSVIRHLDHHTSRTDKMDRETFLHYSDVLFHCRVMLKSRTVHHEYTNPWDLKAHLLLKDDVQVDRFDVNFGYQTRDWMPFHTVPVRAVYYIEEGTKCSLRCKGCVDAHVICFTPPSDVEEQGKGYYIQCHSCDTVHFLIACDHGVYFKLKDHKGRQSTVYQRKSMAVGKRFYTGMMTERQVAYFKEDDDTVTEPMSAFGPVDPDELRGVASRRSISEAYARMDSAARALEDKKQRKRIRMKNAAQQRKKSKKKNKKNIRRATQFVMPFAAAEEEEQQQPAGKPPLQQQSKQKLAPLSNNNKKNQHNLLAFSSPAIVSDSEVEVEHAASDSEIEIASDVSEHTGEEDGMRLPHQV